MQVSKPQFTAESIFNLHDPAAHGLVREIGFGNLSMGTLGLVSLIAHSWVVPAAVAGGMYYGLAGLGHLMRSERNAKEQVALVSDLLIAARTGGVRTLPTVSHFRLARAEPRRAPCARQECPADQLTAGAAGLASSASTAAVRRSESGSVMEKKDVTSRPSRPTRYL